MAGARQRLEELDAVFDAVAHASRRQILLTVWFRGGVVSSSAIAQRFHHKWPTITRHLRVLERAGLLKRERKGRNQFYRVDRGKLGAIKGWLDWFHEKAGSGQEKKR